VETHVPQFPAPPQLPPLPQLLAALQPLELQLLLAQPFIMVQVVPVQHEGHGVQLITCVHEELLLHAVLFMTMHVTLHISLELLFPLPQPPPIPPQLEGVFPLCRVMADELPMQLPLLSNHL
jgi:hypothetical protein